jgi:cytosine/adenosine deaminase-related metal-dependent hydrolase
MALVIKGRVVALDPADPRAVLPGRIWLGDGGLVDAVTGATGPGPAGFQAAPVVDVGDAFILPGLIDLHNHLGYNTLPLWAEPSQQTPFLHHNDWTDEPTYKAAITWPAYVLIHAAPEALLAYVQARALVGGTTAAQGWPTANREAELVLRNVDDEKVGTKDRNLIITSVVTKSPLQLAQVAQSIGRGAGFVYHCAEGQVGSVVLREFTDAANAGCLRRTFIGIHCNAVSATDWARWDKATAGAVAWSPFSNLWLYGSTTDVAAARTRGVSICLGSDWGPSGTKHVLGELKVAKLVNDAKGLGLGDQDLVAMITANPGDELARCWSRQVGRLVPGAFGDVTVIRSRGAGNAWSQVVAATEGEVMLVVVGGKPRYGDAAAMLAGRANVSTTLTVKGAQRRLAIPNPAQPGQAWAFSDIVAKLNAVRKDPAGALHHADGLRRGYRGPGNAPEAPLELVLDMPGGGMRAFAGPPPDPSAVKIPPLPTLVHDQGFLADIRGRGFHGGLLDGLSTYYA